MKNKIQKVIGSIVLVVIILSFAALFMSRCGFALIPVTTRYAYWPILKYRWEDSSIVEHFPSKIPDKAKNVKFCYRAGLFQGGTTMTLTTEGMPISRIHLVLKWVRDETKRRGLSPEELISYVRDEVRKRVLTE